MPLSPCAFVFTPARRRNVVRLGVLALALSFSACSGSRLTTDRAARELKPKEQLPERERRNLPNNLIIKIENVANDHESYKNYVVLRINGREIAPVEKISNVTSSYSYPMRLQPGVYEIKAEYHAVGYWREQIFDIVTDEAVKVMPDQRTVLVARLEKNHRGDLAEKPAKFRITYENLAPALSEARAEAVAPIKVMPFSSNIMVPALRDAEQQRTPVAPPPAAALPKPDPVVPPPTTELPPPQTALFTLQINTSPAGADVIVDDRYYGQAPVKVTIDRNQNHVIQISHQGYKEIVKVLNAADLQNETLMQLVLKLEAAQQQ